MIDRQALCDVAASFYARGYAFGSTGNLSIRTGEQHVWITPTGGSLKDLTPERLALIDMNGECLNENRPSKEYPFHLAAYRAAPRAKAIVHLHSTYTVALSCLANLDEAEPMQPFTPYYLMRVAPLAVLPYFRPGSDYLAEAVEHAAGDHDCMILRNHGAICLGTSLNEAVDRTEELEETAKLYFLLRGHNIRYLSTDERDEIRRVFGR